jgi:hypothetical protein
LFDEIVRAPEDSATSGDGIADNLVEILFVVSELVRPYGVSNSTWVVANSPLGQLDQDRDEVQTLLCSRPAWDWPTPPKSFSKREPIVEASATIATSATIHPRSTGRGWS